jgi:hypothetical protein
MYVYILWGGLARPGVRYYGHYTPTTIGFQLWIRVTLISLLQSFLIVSFFFFSFFFCLFCECDLAYIDRYPSVDAPGFSCYGRRPIERALAMDLSSEFITYPSLFMHM